MAVSRRKFLKGSTCTAALAASVRVFGLTIQAPSGTGNEVPPARPVINSGIFPPKFLFGAATSCVQIEGAAAEDGKGESIWDRFCSRPGTIRDGSTPSVTCDSYHHWPEDIALLKAMGLHSYRMSIAWPRILPSGSGAVNQKGLDHYSRIIDALKEIGVHPLITCYHWDLPLVLEEAGGWPNRDTAMRFADYTALLAKKYGDRVQNWCLLNEPQAFTVAGYGWGVHAPGIKNRDLMLRATHTANLAQAAGFRAMKAERHALKIGIAHDIYPVHPASTSDADHLACNRFDAFRNRWFIDPAFTGKYPEAFAGGNPYETMGFRPGDEALLRAPLDYTGINYYSGLGVVAAGDGENILRGLNSHEVREQAVQFYPDGMKEVLLDLKKRYKRPIVITETGYEETEELMTDGPVHDSARIRYLNSTLMSVLEAIAAGADVRGIHIWSLIDDWEWQDGFQSRLGLAQVDYRNPVTRRLKDSGIWYGQVARSRALPTPA